MERTEMPMHVKGIHHFSKFLSHDEVSVSDKSDIKPKKINKYHCFNLQVQNALMKQIFISSIIQTDSAFIFQQSQADEQKPKGLVNH